MASFRDKRVVVTGAARGIGRLMAEGIAAEGGHPILLDVDEEALEAAAKAIRARGHSCDTHVCNVADRGAVAATCARILENGRVDVLINNAGVISGRFLLELSDEAIERTFAVNTLGLFWMTRALLPSMIAQGQGHIVTIASAGGIVGTAKQTDYAASKHAAVGFDEALRCELKLLGHRGIRTTVVCPFYIATGMFEGVRSSRWMPILQPEPATRRILAAIRRGRRRVHLPRSVALIYLGRLLPTSWLDLIMRRLGVTHSMDAFSGRGAAPPQVPEKSG